MRSQRVADAIVDCRNAIRMDRLERALKTAVKQGYIKKDEVSSVRKGLKTMMPQNVSFLERAIRKLANSNVGLFPTVDEAIEWANDFIKSIDG